MADESGPGWLARPIPAWLERPLWQRIPICESGEPLVAVPTSADANTIARADYAGKGMPGALQTIYVRSGVADRLLAAAVGLREAGATLVIFDGYRPLAVQKNLFDTYAATVRLEHPNLPQEELTERVRRFVAFPSADPLCPPPHLTGGAADVYLVDSLSGDAFPMGTEPDATEEASATRFFEEHPEEPFRLNRRLLYSAMVAQGFNNYREEWWHFDFGNQRWANVAGAANAIYGIPGDPIPSPE